MYCHFLCSEALNSKENRKGIKPQIFTLTQSFQCKIQPQINIAEGRKKTIGFLLDKKTQLAWPPILTLIKMFLNNNFKHNYYEHNATHHLTQSYRVWSKYASCNSCTSVFYSDPATWQNYCTGTISQCDRVVGFLQLEFTTTLFVDRDHDFSVANLQHSDTE